MEILLHICCAPCATYTVKALMSDGFDPVGYFYNPNIQPFREYRRRLETVQQYAEALELDVVYQDEYILEDFIRQSLEVDDRCALCYSLRLPLNAKKESTIRGLLFVDYLSLVMRMRFINQMRENGLLRSYTVEKLLLELEKIKKIQQSNGDIIVTEITKKQNDIL